MEDSVAFRQFQRSGFWQRHDPKRAASARRGRARGELGRGLCAHRRARREVTRGRCNLPSPLQLGRRGGRGSVHFL